MIGNSLRLLVGVLATALVVPSMALGQTTVNLGAGDADICLVSDSTGVNYWCQVGQSGTAMPDGAPYQFNGGSGDDRMRVRSGGGCICACSGFNNFDFVYDGDVIFNGEDDKDRLYGGSGVDHNVLAGGSGDDVLRGGPANGDELGGGAGLDILYDPAGANESYSGGLDSDKIRDVGGSLNMCDAGAGYDYFYPSGTCTNWEETWALTSIGCP